MARRIEIKNPNLPAIKTLYTVNDTPIGTGKNVTNTRAADVQLVQFFLSQFFAQNPQLYKQLAPTKSGKFLIDGDCGAQTKSGIWVYQTWEQKRGKPIHPDGVVSPPTQYTSPSGRNTYTILLLNEWYGDNYGYEYYGKLENHPDLRDAAALRADLGKSSV
jgi:hypothetical protein